MATVVTFLGAAPALASDANVNPSSGELSFQAAEGLANAVVASGAAPSITITDPADPITPGFGCVSIDATTVACEGVSQLTINVRDKDDLVTNDSDVEAFIYGRNGNDTLTGGSGADTLRGENENDVLDGRGGDDRLIGDGDELTGVGNDQLIGGEGVDLASFGAAGALTIDLSAPGPQNTGDGIDSLSGIESINGSAFGDRLIGDALPNTLLGKGGDDEIRIRDGGSDAAGCGSGYDLVVLDRSDTLLDPHACEEVNDGQAPSGTTITSGPTGPTADPRWEFTSDEPWADFECTVIDSGGDLVTATWTGCRSGEAVPAPADGDWTFGVRAVDDQGQLDLQPASRDFTLDTVAPDTEVQGPSGTTSDSTPEFFLSSPDPAATFLCRFDSQSFFVCSSPLTADPLADGEHTLDVVATDDAGNIDQSPASISFRVDTSGPGPAPGDGPAAVPQAPQTPQTSQAPQAPQAQQAKIIIGSLVLISGRRVKMSRKGRVSISLTCAGAVRCRGRLSITTAEPVSKSKRKLVTLGARRFTIGANRKRKIRVRFSKRKMRLAKRLKRFKAKAVIREIDSRGNLRISSRVFILRAR
ncbi:MAG: Ig-like domain-containing protein [Solirubrobacterales bacterium]